MEVDVRMQGPVALSTSPPKHTTPPMKLYRVQSSEYGVDYRDMRPPLPIPPEKYSLPVFIAKFHESLPLPVRVCRGFCGQSEETSISEGDRFNFHFSKHTMVVAMECDNRSRFNVPLNSAIAFGLLYNPNGNDKEAMKGFRFDKVSDILQMGTLPRVIRVRKGHQGSTPESSIAANELLIVRKVVKRFMGKQLKLLSLTTGKEKTLSENCIGHFSTKPRDVSLYLPEIVKHIPDAFPYKAVMFSTADIAWRMPSKLDGSVVTLTHSSIETSLVATSVLEQDPLSARLLDIPIDLDIHVRVLNANDFERRKLLNDTAYHYHHFDPSKLCPYVNKTISRSGHETQSILYTMLRQGQEQQGVDVKRPQSVPEVAPLFTFAPPTYNITRSTTNFVASDPESFGYMCPPRRIPVRAPQPLPPESEYVNTGASTNANVQPAQSLGESSQKRTPGYSYVETHPEGMCVRPEESSRSPVKRSGSIDYSGSGHFAPEGAGESATDGSAGAVVCKRSNSDIGVNIPPLQNASSNSGVVSAEPACGGGDSDALDSVMSELDKITRELAIDSAILDSLEVEASTDSNTTTDITSSEGELAVSSNYFLVTNPSETEPVVEDESPYYDFLHRHRHSRPPSQSYENIDIPDLEQSQEAASEGLETADPQLEEKLREIHERNKRQLKAMDGAQILKLLEAMGLQQYHDVFRDQQINGDLLSECDEDILKSELQVSSRLHRMRLVKLIAGQYSVQEIMSGRDGYVVMFPAK